MIIIVNAYSVLVGLSLRAGGPGWGSPLATMNVVDPQLLSYENRRNIESKEIPNPSIPAYLWYLTGNLKS